MDDVSPGPAATAGSALARPMGGTSLLMSGALRRGLAAAGLVALLWALVAWALGAGA